MAAVSPMSMYAEEIRLQAAAALAATLNANQLVVAEHPSARSFLTHSVVRVEFLEIERTQADNEADMVAYSLDVLFATMSPDGEAAGRLLEDWARTLSLTLGDRASDRSPLRTNPLPLSSLDPNAINVYLFDIELGTSIPGQLEGESGFRHARNLGITATTYEQRT